MTLVNQSLLKPIFKKNQKKKVKVFFGIFLGTNNTSCCQSVNFKECLTDVHFFPTLV